MLKRDQFITASLIILSICQGCVPTKKLSKEQISDEIVQSDWLYWRGSEGNGVSKQTGLPVDLNSSLIWSHDIQGGGVPVIAGGKAYQFGYYGVTDDLQEALVCFDASTGQVLWNRRHSDFISDIVYNRYRVGAACVDPASGNGYFQTSPGLLIGYDSGGNKLWEDVFSISMILLGNSIKMEFQIAPAPLSRISIPTFLSG